MTHRDGLICDIHTRGHRVLRCMSSISVTACVDVLQTDVLVSSCLTLTEDAEVEDVECVALDREREG